MRGRIGDQKKKVSTLCSELLEHLHYLLYIPTLPHDPQREGDEPADHFGSLVA